MKIRDLNQDEKLKSTLEVFAKNPSGFILLSGKNGTGKSFAAMAVYEQVSPFKLPYHDRDIAYFLTQAELNMIWQKQFKEHGHAYHLLEDVIKSQLLILDDIGTRIPSDSFMDFLYEVADKRYSLKNVKGTIITTNLNMTDMREKFGDAFVSRVASGKCFRIEGTDRRFNPSNSS